MLKTWTTETFINGFQIQDQVPFDNINNKLHYIKKLSLQAF